MTPRKQALILFAGAVLFAAIAAFLRPAPMTVGEEVVALSAAGRICIALLALAIVLWITEALPFHVTALVVMLAMPLLGVTDGMAVLRGGAVDPIHGIAAGYKEIVRMSFGNDLLLFFLGVFFLSAAFSETSLGQRLTLGMLRIVGTSTRRVILGFLVLGTLLSMWVSNVGVAAIMLPIGVGILRQAGRKPLESNLGRALMIACCWGPIFGGIATPAGCGPNPIAIAYMRDIAGMNISFVDWMMIGVPTALLLIPFGWVVLILLFPPEIAALPLTREDIEVQRRELGPLDRREKAATLVFLTVIILWVGNPLLLHWTDGAVDLPISLVSILGGLFLILPPFRVLTWEQANRATSWDSILLIMSSLGIGMMAWHTGAARWMAVALLSDITALGPVVLIFVVVLVVILMKLFLASNTVTGIIIIPILISLAQAFDLPAWSLVGPAAFTSSLGIILVTQTPTNVIPYTAGYFSIQDFAKAGIIMSLIMVVLVAGMIAVLGPLTGMYQY